MATPLDIEMVAAIGPNARENGLDSEFPYLLETCRKYEITTKNRLAAFLGNLFKESGELYYVEEIADGSDYEGREDLGNVYAGDGVRYKGRGYIQITGRNNYRAVGAALEIDAEGDPGILSQTPYAWESAGWYWRYGSSWGNLNDYADEGDFGSTVLGVRGGEDDDRWRYWYTAIQVLPSDVEIPSEEEAMSEYPESLVAPDKSGWIKDDATGAYVRTDTAEETYYTDANRWLYVVRDEAVTPDPDQVLWEWPYAWDDPDPFSAWYVERHPTRYFFRPDVDALARRVIDAFPDQVWPNTYEEHPEGWGYEWGSTDDDGTTWYVEHCSVDFWAYSGRGGDIGGDLGQEVFDYIFNDPQPPWIRWCIWWGWIWIDGVGWQAWWDDGTGGHYDHPHFTFH